MLLNVGPVSTACYELILLNPKCLSIKFDYDSSTPNVLFNKIICKKYKLIFQASAIFFH